MRILRPAGNAGRLGPVGGTAGTPGDWQVAKEGRASEPALEVNSIRGATAALSLRRACGVNWSAA